MTRKQRVYAAFAHQPPDQIPVFEQSIASSVASEVLGRPALTGSSQLHYAEACAWMAGDQAHSEFEEQHWENLVDTVRAFDWDLMRQAWRLNERPSRQLDEHTFQYGDDDEHIIRRYAPDSQTFGVVARHPVLTDPAQIEPEIARREAEVADLKYTADDFPDLMYLLDRFSDEYAIPAPSGIAISYISPWLEATVLRPDLVVRHLDCQVEEALKKIDFYHSVGVRIVWGGGDLADKHGPFYSPTVFHELMLPRIQRITSRCQELGMYYVYRTDGNLWPIADDFFLHSGIHGFGEIDYAAGMHIPEVKARYPHLTFWGNVPCGSLLYSGTPTEVSDFVKRLIDDVGTDGGLIVGSSNSLIQGTPVENAVALYETARTYGRVS